MTKAKAKETAAVEQEIDVESVEAVEPAVAMEPEELITPSWFRRTYGESGALDMAEHYRTTHVADVAVPPPMTAGQTAAYEAYKKRLEERFATAQQMVDPTFLSQGNRGFVQTPFVSGEFPQRPNYAYVMPTAPQRQKKQARTTVLGVKPSTLIAITIAACAIGSSGGYFVANPEKASGLLSQASMSGWFFFGPSETPKETVIGKKTIRSAKLEVRDVAGAINSPIPLDISALPPDEQTPIALRISGLPDAAYLTKGVEVAKGEWVLKAADVASAELIVPHTNSPRIALEVAALEEKTGAIAAPSQDMRVALDTTVVPLPGVPQQSKSDGQLIVPANAVPDQGFNKLTLPPAVPVPLESLNPDAQNLINKGDTLLGAGDVLAARQFYLKAFKLKATSAAYGVGQTFDPAVYAKFKIRGLAPDPTQAAEWYGKAAAEGHVEAQAALAQLQ
jgi:hypothetical protein